MNQELQSNHHTQTRNCSSVQKMQGSPTSLRCSLYGITTRGSQHHNVRRTNTCVSLVKNSEAEQSEPVLELPLSVGSYLYSLWISCVLLQDYYSKNPFICVCFRKTFFYMCALAKHPCTCVIQQKVKWHNWLSKETRSFHFTSCSDVYIRGWL